MEDLGADEALFGLCERGMVVVVHHQIPTPPIAPPRARAIKQPLGSLQQLSPSSLAITRQLFHRESTKSRTSSTIAPTKNLAAESKDALKTVANGCISTSSTTPNTASTKPTISNLAKRRTPAQLPTPKGAFPLKNLPRELRDLIYDHILCDFTAEIYALDSTFLSPDHHSDIITVATTLTARAGEIPLFCPPILLVDKQTSEETTAAISRHSRCRITGDFRTCELFGTEVNALVMFEKLYIHIGSAIFGRLGKMVELLEKALRLLLEASAHPRWEGRVRAVVINMWPIMGRIEPHHVEKVRKLIRLVKELTRYKGVKWEIEGPGQWLERNSTPREKGELVEVMKPFIKGDGHGRFGNP
ncbi:uncharacterized protein BDZ99DRAFT_577621 [Mytilinidion resinicola]|uniref:F-box domain-containing protein n=1 Tax=Mytilinidion resinicola TaxID=574789 RepID=A0A6A6XZV1_9PEZI|nr:uncharacterized protein BDZ99DRAFT_577621 [Mytilinidion resinicola]KAF2801495.1 hypothetical protein BDZ99DRAFT_577621 [Mytilinidion resinicola]